MGRVKGKEFESLMEPTMGTWKGQYFLNIFQKIDSFETQIEKMQPLPRQIHDM